MSGSIPVYVISLARAADRRAHMERMLFTIGLEATFIEAVDGERLTPEQRNRCDAARARRVYGCAMTDAELACYLSHLRAYETLLASSAEAALILEDDVTCSSELKIVLEAAKAAQAPWLVLRLQSTKKAVREPADERAYGDVVDRIAGHDVCRLRTGVLGGCGYLVRREAAQRLLVQSRRIYMPIDQMMDRYWENGIAPYVLRPFPVRHDYLFASAIGERGRKLAAMPLFGRWTRRAQRLVDSANKRLYWRRFNASRANKKCAPLSLTNVGAAFAVTIVAAFGATAWLSIAASPTRSIALLKSQSPLPPTLPYSLPAAVGSPSLAATATPAPPRTAECTAFLKRRAEKIAKRWLYGAKRGHVKSVDLDGQQKHKRHHKRPPGCHWGSDLPKPKPGGLSTPASSTQPT